jgi:hypothetical protein
MPNLIDQIAQIQRENPKFRRFQGLRLRRALRHGVVIMGEIAGCALIEAYGRSGNAVPQHELGAPQWRAKCNDRKERDRIVFGDDNVNRPHPYVLAGVSIEALLDRTAQLAPPYILRSHDSAPRFQARGDSKAIC